MRLDMTFEESNQRIDVHFAEVQTASDGGFERGYAEGYTEGNEQGRKEGYSEAQEETAALFGIQNEVTGTNIVTCDYVNENEHNVEVKLSSDTVTDFSGVEVKIVEANLLDYMQVVRNYESKNYEMVNGYYVTSLQFEPNTNYYIKVNGVRAIWTTFLISTQKQVNASQSKTVGVSNTWFSENAVTTDETGLIYFGLSHSPTGSLNKIEQTLKEALVQIETGEYATDYEPYIEKTYTANADGTVDGMTSISPTMNLICDTEGINITAKYYQCPSAEYDRLWDNLQKGGTYHFSRGYAFVGEQWTNETFKPKYPIRNTYANCLFEYSNIKGDLREMADFDFSKNVNFYYTFAYSKFSAIGVVDTRGANSLASTFLGSTIETIERLILKDTGSQALGNVFNQMELLKNIVVEGVIGRDINLQWSSRLTIESAKNIIQCLANYSGTNNDMAYTVTFHNNVWDALKAEGNASPNGNTWEDYLYDIGWAKA